ncbi:MAG: hypothetical protein JEZ04_17725 [Spirochaetales bacterium]|nr:hypothetical protein [Spirochaetales bacterium]
MYKKFWILIIVITSIFSGCMSVPLSESNPVFDSFCTENKIDANGILLGLYNSGSQSGEDTAFRLRIGKDTVTDLNEELPQVIARVDFVEKKGRFLKINTKLIEGVEGDDRSIYSLIVLTAICNMSGSGRTNQGSYQNSTDNMMRVLAAVYGGEEKPDLPEWVEKVYSQKNIEGIISIDNDMLKIIYN